MKIQWGAISVNNGNVPEQPFYTNFSSATSYSITTQMSRNDGSTPQGFVSVKHHKANAFQVQIVRSTDYMYPSTIQWFAIGV